LVDCSFKIKIAVSHIMAWLMQTAADGRHEKALNAAAYVVAPSTTPPPTCCHRRRELSVIVGIV
jgi:hypothetical protein